MSNDKKSNPSKVKKTVIIDLPKDQKHHSRDKNRLNEFKSYIDRISDLISERSHKDKSKLFWD